MATCTQMTSLWLLLLLMTSWMTLTSADWTLTVLHTNDVHARYMEFDVNGSPCAAARRRRRRDVVTSHVDKRAVRECYGGQARLKTAIAEEKAKAPGSTILLDAGDQYQGTLWFYKYGGNVTTTFMNWQGYDVMALGNHEFDNGVDGLVPHLKSANFPIVSANIDVSQEPTLAGLIKKSTVLNVSGRRVGVVGFITEDVPLLSTTGKVQFINMLSSVQSEVQRLRNDGVKFIIALGHAGYALDQQLALIPGVDVVVGGHTNTFLYTGTPPSTEKPVGVYPTVVIRPDGSKGLVVQDFNWAKYLGVLRITFNEQGDVISYGGNPRLLDNSVAQDPATLQQMEPYIQGIQQFMLSTVGRTIVKLEGDRTFCRQTECNLGSVIADSMVHHVLRHPDATTFADVVIGLVNGGGIRDTINPGDITMQNVLNVLPFKNTLVAIKVTGATLNAALEYSVSTLDPCNNTDLAGRFLQVSGLRVKYDLRQSAGQRVKNLDVLCVECDPPEYRPLNASATYKIIVNGFMANGGDGFTMLRNGTLDSLPLGVLDSDVLMDYVRNMSPVIQPLEGRLEYVARSNVCVSNKEMSALAQLWLINRLRKDD